MFLAGLVLFGSITFLEMAVHLGHWRFKDIIARTESYRVPVSIVSSGLEGWHVWRRREPGRQ